MCETEKNKQILSDEFRPLACFCGYLFATRRRRRKAPNEFALNVKKKTTKKKKKPRADLRARDETGARLPAAFLCIEGR